MQLGNQTFRIILILVNSLNIRKKSKLFRMDSLGNGAGCVICVNIIGIIIVIISHRKNDRQEILLQKLMENPRVYLLDLAYISNVLAI